MWVFVWFAASNHDHEAHDDGCSRTAEQKRIMTGFLLQRLPQTGAAQTSEVTKAPVGPHGFEKDFVTAWNEYCL